MSPSNSISPRQLGIAQTLWSQFYAHRALDFADTDSRQARLQWARDLLGYAISSFKNLSRSEANVVIDALKRAMGAPSGRSGSQQDGEDRGLQGRSRQPRGPRHLVMASAEDRQRVQRAIERLGWSRVQFETWLSSATSPLAGRTEIRSQADANRVWWALKAMLRRAGKWKRVAGNSLKSAIDAGPEALVPSRGEETHAQ